LKRIKTRGMINTNGSSDEHSKVPPAVQSSCGPNCVSWGSLFGDDERRRVHGFAMVVLWMGRISSMKKWGVSDDWKGLV